LRQNVLVTASTTGAAATAGSCPVAAASAARKSPERTRRRDVVDGGVVVDARREVREVAAHEVQLEVVERARAARRAVVVRPAVRRRQGAVERAVGQEAEPAEQGLVGDHARRAVPGRGDRRQRGHPGVRQLTGELDRRERLVDLVEQRLDVPVLLPDRRGAVGGVADADPVVARLDVAERVVLRGVVESHRLLVHYASMWCATRAANRSARTIV
jgi:hypothetical protein